MLGLTLVYRVADPFFVKRNGSRFCRTLHFLRTPVSVAAALAAAVILIAGRATLVEMLIILLAALAAAFL